MKFRFSPIIIKMHQTSTVKLWKNTIFTKPISSIFVTYFCYMKVFQVLYLASNKINESIDIFIMISKNDLNLFFCVYVEIYHIYNLHFKHDSFFVNLPCFHPIYMVFAYAIYFSYSLIQNNKKSNIHSFVKFTKTQTFQHAQLHKNTSISWLIYTKTNKPNIHNIFCPTL